MSLRIHDDIAQGTPEWHDLRRGIVTASVVGKLITSASPEPLTVDCATCPALAGSPCLSMAKRKEPAAIKTYHPERIAFAASLPADLTVADTDTSQAITAALAAERVAGFTEDAPMTSDMWRGVESEPYARDLYGGHFGAVTECGFMVREEDGWQLGYSPDGLVGDDGLIEVKAPRSKGHLLTAIAGEVPAQYMAQCQAGLFVSGRKWLDFVSFVGGMHLYVKRVTPDPQWFAAIEAACRTFEANAAALVADYLKAVDGMPVAERIELVEVI